MNFLSKIQEINNFIIFILLTSMVSKTLSGPSEDIQATVVKQESHIAAEGNYAFNYETSNGIFAQEKGIGAEYATGGYSYYSPDGELIQLSYVADGNGFQPAGSHIPIAPPIPYAILKSLEYLRTHPQYVEEHKG